MSNTTKRTLCIAALALALGASLFAHETANVGQLRMTVGWGDEPAFSGLKNSVDVDVVDAHGAPVADLEGWLAVQIVFGEERITRPLVPSRERAGRYTTSLVPTRPGTYTFHITGRLKGEAVQMASTCSNMTFACVSDVSEIHFPAKDPSAGQLAERLGRTLPRAETAVATATAARNVGMVATAMAAIAFAATLVTAGRRRRREA